MRATGPGLDGIRYSFWAIALQYAAELFCLLAVFLPDIIQDLPFFNDSTMRFLPKKVVSNEKEIYQKPSETRPLNLKNSDNKILSSLLNCQLAPVVAAKAHAAQR